MTSHFKDDPRHGVQRQPGVPSKSSISLGNPLGKDDVCAAWEALREKLHFGWEMNRFYITEI